jgi:hypothetical protein
MALQAGGVIRNWGVSNFDVGDMAELLSLLGAASASGASGRTVSPVRLGPAAGMATADNYPIGGCAATARPANLSLNVARPAFP